MSEDPVESLESKIQPIKRPLKIFALFILWVGLSITAYHVMPYFKTGGLQRWDVAIIVGAVATYLMKMMFGIFTFSKIK